MKNKLIYIASLLVLIPFVSCKKSYLDKKPPSSLLLSDAIKSETDLSVALNGAYASLRNTNLYGRTLPVKGDLMADNTYVTTANSGRYLTMNSLAFFSLDPDVVGIWTSAYASIKNANTVINAGLNTSVNVNQYVGEALAIRALMHFELVRNFATPYTVDPNAPGVPIVTSFNQNAHYSRGTVKDVYTQIINDLEQAYTLMTLYRGTGYFSKYAARALEARVYQNMGDWAHAKTVALDVVNNSGWTMLPAASYVSPSGTLGTGGASPTNTYSPGGYWANPAAQTSTKIETFFEVISDLQANNGFDQIGFIYLNVGGGYGDLLATDNLYNLYSPTDVRLGLIPQAPAGYRSGQAGNIYLCYKYPNPAGSGDKDDTKVIRLSDVILILAEAYYNTGDPANALIQLNKVAQQRDPSFAGYSSSGAQLLTDILNERRKELAFEGNRFWDLVRLKISYTKIKNLNPLTTISVAPGYQGLIFPIPQNELDNNPNMTQNPGY
jgi:hypothetical protein